MLKQQALKCGATQHDVDCLDDHHDVKAAAIELVCKVSGESLVPSVSRSDTLLARLTRKAEELSQKRQAGDLSRTPQEIEIWRAVGLMQGRMHSGSGLAELTKASELARKFYGSDARVVAEINASIKGTVC